MNIIICKEKCHCERCHSACDNAIEYAPIRYGYWITHEYAEEVEGCLINNYECSYCHNWQRDTTMYCPICGCVMEIA